MIRSPMLRFSNNIHNNSILQSILGPAILTGSSSFINLYYYHEDVLTVLGHTPTRYYDCPGRVFRTDTWIDIDTGAGQGSSLMLLRLNDLKEFYVEQRNRS